MEGRDAPEQPAGDPLAEATGMDRRGFLSVAGGALLLCTIDGKQVAVRTPEDVERVDAAMASLRRPKSRRPRREPARDPLDSASFARPEPQPGGQLREYWIAARPVRWNVAPNGDDQWMGRAAPRPSRFTALVYQRYTAGFAEPMSAPRMPGPTLRAEVGDVIAVHFRNMGTGRYAQPLTVHPHGVRYTPDYDGAYLGDFTRVGGFVEPGEEFTYFWEATPDSVGVWPYHDHGPNHTLNSFRGLFGTIIVKERGEPIPDVERVLWMHSFSPQVTGIPRLIHCINGRTYAGNTPTIRAKVGQSVALHAIGGDSSWHTFHIHGHRWRDASGAWVDNPGFGPNEVVTAAFVEDNPGRWLYHCHVFTHQDMGMAGWYMVDP
ncbi:MAG: multicopper oxidase domain-containing protein [Solirubrobacterales bacterium]|nr:multicopper oxidase domain-containing protein [Solirubrobacterales bacterium]